MATEREYYTSIGMPGRVAERPEILRPHSVGVIIHTGYLEIAERRVYGAEEPNVLLLRQADQFVDGFHPWGIPAGRSERDESIFETARREVLEETGIEIERERLRWFCPVSRNGAVLSYRVEHIDIANLGMAQLHEFGIRSFPPHAGANPREIDRAALVPVEFFGDLGMIGSRYTCRQVASKDRYTYYPNGESVDEDIDFVPIMYKYQIWRSIRNQMLLRRIIPDF